MIVGSVCHIAAAIIERVVLDVAAVHRRRAPRVAHEQTLRLPPGRQTRRGGGRASEAVPGEVHAHGGGPDRGQVRARPSSDCVSSTPII